MALSRKQIDNRAKKRAQLESQIAALEEQITRIDNEFKAEMVAAGIDRLEGLEFEATWVKQIQNRFNQVEFRKEHSDLYEAYKRPEERQPFNCKEMTAKKKEAARLAAAAEKESPSYTAEAPAVAAIGMA